MTSSTARPSTPPTAPADANTQTAPGRRLLRFLGSFRGILALAAVLLLGAFFSPRDPSTGWPIFLTLATQSDILYEFAQIGLLAAGMTFVIISGGIDLSVGSVLGLTAMLFSLLYIGLGWNPIGAAIVCLAAGTLCGAINGVLIARLRLQPFVATLAMMVAARGAAELVSGNIQIEPGAKAWYAIKAGDRLGFYEWMNHSILQTNIRPITVLFLLTVLIGLVIIKYTRFGRSLYAIGGNEQAARLSGINVDHTKIAAYAACGLTAALAGICNAAKNGAGFPQAGLSFELDAIAAVVIGGTALSGGSGGMFFTLIGTLVIADITKILSIKNVEEPFKLIARGALIVAAVLIQQRRSRS